MDEILHVLEQFGQGLLGVVGEGDLEFMAVNVGGSEQIDGMNCHLRGIGLYFKAD